jgi:hypothetical protein
MQLRRPEVKVILWRGSIQWDDVYSKFHDSWFVSVCSTNGQIHICSNMVPKNVINVIGL